MKKLCPQLYFESHLEKKGSIEHLLTSLMNERNELLQDRKKWMNEMIEETKLKLEKDLKKLIHQTAERMGIDSAWKEIILEGLNLDLRNIYQDKSLPSFNKQLFISDVRKELEEKYLKKLKNEFEESFLVSPRINLGNKVIKIQEFLNPLEKEDHDSDEIMKLKSFLELCLTNHFVIDGDAGTGKTVFSK